jgi:hypothetical protein
MEGWIKLHRKILEHYLFKEKRVFSKFEAWNYILLTVNHKPSKFLLGNELIELKEGQMITSQSKLMEKFGWSKSKLNNFFDLLEKDSMIVVDADSKKTTLTVIKYRDYQVLETAKRPLRDHQETAEGLRKDTNNNEENKKNDNNEEKEYTHPLILFAKENAPDVMKMKAPLTNELCDKLATIYGIEKVKHILTQMHNKNDLLKKYKSAYLTANDWLKRDKKDAPKTGLNLINKRN